MSPFLYERNSNIRVRGGTIQVRLKTSSRIAREEDEVTSNMCQFGLAILFVERVGIGLVLKCLEKTIKEH